MYFLSNLLTMKIFGALVLCLHVSSPNSETKDCEKGVIGSNLCHDAKWKQYNDANKKKFTGLYAMKTLRKRDIFTKSQQAHVIAEKDILSEANNDWIVKLHYSFRKENIRGRVQTT